MNSLLKSFFGRSYQHVATLTGPRDGIQSISFSVDAIFVSASGYGGVTIWNVKNAKPVSTPHLPYDHQNPKHSYSASTWMYFEGIDKHVFIVGNMAGEIFIWTWDHTLQAFREAATQIVCHNSNNQVMSMDVVDARVPLGSRGRIVTSTADCTVAVWSLTSNLEISNVFTADLQKDLLPRTVKFVRGTENVFVFSKLGGSFIQLHGQNGQLLWAKKDGPKEMHSVSIDEASDLFAAWIGHHAATFRLSNSELVRTFEGEDSLYGNTKQVSFAENGSILVVGSDHGIVEVFEVASGTCAQRLTFPRTAAVQYVATSTLPKYHLIAVAASNKGKPGDVIIYKKKSRGLRKSSSSVVSCDDNLAVNLRITWTGLKWFAYLLLLFFTLYGMLTHYSTAITFGIEASVYPIGFGYRGFVYLPALSRFENVKLSMPAAVSAPVSPFSNTADTQMDRLDCLSTLTDTFTVIHTEHATVTITETTTFTTTAYLISTTSAKALSGSVIRM